MVKSGPLLLTGAAGNLGTWLRPHLANRQGGLRSSDIRPFRPALPGEEIVLADLTDEGAMERVVRGVSAIVHLGAVSVEDSFDRVLHVNIQGTYTLFELARRENIKRIVYASSIHVIGLYPTSQRLDSEAPLRPDSYYAVSKAFGENLARLYCEKAGMEIACLRIGVVLPEPKTVRNLWTWLSITDLQRLVDVCLDSPVLRFSIIYGISNNRRGWWDNARSDIPYRPLDDAETYVDRIAALREPSVPDDPLLSFHGGPFALLPLGQRPS